MTRAGPSGCLGTALLTLVFSCRRLTPATPKFLISFYLFLLSQRFSALHPPTFHCRWLEASSHRLHLQAHQLVSVLIKESYLSLRAHPSSAALCEAAVIHPSPASLLRAGLCCDAGQGGCGASTAHGAGRLQPTGCCSPAVRTSIFLPSSFSFFREPGPLGLSFCIWSSFLLRPGRGPHELGGFHTISPGIT